MTKTLAGRKDESEKQETDGSQSESQDINGGHGTNSDEGTGCLRRDRSVTAP